METLACKLLIIGGGPGGYVCGIRAGQLGLDTIIVDQNPPGGTCLNVGCIPSKALIHASDDYYHLAHLQETCAYGLSAEGVTIDFARVINWKNGIVERLNQGVSSLLKKAGTRWISGQVEFIDGKTVRVHNGDQQLTIKAENIVIATGSEPVALPQLPFGEHVIDSAAALALDSIPQKLAIIGAGYIGLELGTAFAKLGSDVTILEAGEHILPLYDRQLVQPVVECLKQLNVKIYTNIELKNLNDDGALIIDHGGDVQAIKADKILVTAGRRPVLTGFNLENLYLTMDGKFIKIDEQCRTSMRGIYAIGDVTNGAMLAHRAMAQGEMVAEIIAGHKRGWDKRAIVSVCYTDPEIVSVGLSFDEFDKQTMIVGLFPLQANGRAMTLAREDGFIRVIARKDDHLILGIQAVGAHVSELSASFALAMEAALRLEDITGTIHAHPTLSEAFPEACWRALGAGLHI